MKKEYIDICEEAISTYGVDNQKWMIIEEIGELLNAFGKDKRRRCVEDDIITELADVYIMIMQFAIYYGLNKFEDEVVFKMERLKARLNKKKI